MNPSEKPQEKIDVYVETGKTRAVAGALDWPGWCRIGKDEPSALQALLEYGPRYSLVMGLAGLAFTPPGELAVLEVVERLEGTSSTDFGVPEKAPSADLKPVNDVELRRFQAIMQACWQALDAAALKAQGKALRKGPRGGGREADEIVRHVWMAETSYLSRLGVKIQAVAGVDPAQAQATVRQAILEALARSVRGELPIRGPRGGLIWGARYFVRRAAWHVLDHAWEIEDKIMPS